MSKNGPYPSKHIHLHEMFHKEKYLSLEKVIPIDKFANHYKMVFPQKRPTRVVILLVSLTHPKQTCQQKIIILLNRITVIKETGPKVGCFAGFFHHRLTPMSAHMHAYRYPLVENGMKTGLRAIAYAEKIEYY